MSSLVSLSSILDIIYYPFGFLLSLIYKFTGLILSQPNFVLTIVLFGVIVKAIMVPFAVSNEKTRLRNIRIQPKMKAIQEKYKGNTRDPKYQEELQKLYTAENYNPMKGCLPQLIQFPIIFAVFNAIRRPLTYINDFGSETVKNIAKKLFEIGDTNIVGIFKNNIENITEKAASYQEIMISGSMKAHFDEVKSVLPDTFANLKSTDLINTDFLGVDNLLGVTPTWGWNLTIIIPILSGLTSLLISIISMRLNRDPNQEKQAGMGAMKGLMLFMPLFSVWVGFQYTIGVGIYWIISNLLAGLQTIILFYVFKKKREKAEAALAAEKSNKEIKINYNQIEKQQREANAEKAAKHKKNK